MSDKNDFDDMEYAVRILKSKGFDPEASDEWADIFELQWFSWRDLIARHRLGDDPEKAEQILKSFVPREVIGGFAKVIEAFAKHLDIQPKRTGSPDWEKAGREWRECAYCDGRGVISNVPVQVERRGEIIDRTYSFACVCDRGRFFAGMRVADDWMIRFAAERKLEEIKGHEAKLRRYGIDPMADPHTMSSQFRAAILAMKRQVASGKATAKSARPFIPQTAEQARRIIDERKKAHAVPPPQLDPDAMALAVYGNGDERNEWGANQ